MRSTGTSRCCWWSALISSEPSSRTIPSRSRSLLSTADLAVSDIAALMQAAFFLEREDFLQRAHRLAKRRVALLFYESSTRTRTSFELAAKGLGADTTLVSALSSSIEKGESLKDTGLTLRALGAECIILRHPNSGAPFLLDRRTILHRLKPEHTNAEIDESILAGVTVLITGDILHSRVARSNAELLPRLGARVILCGPEALLPECALEIGPG